MPSNPLGALFFVVKMIFGRYIVLSKGKNMCGIVGMVSTKEVSARMYLGLWSSQHRGKESAGVVTYDGITYHECRRMGTIEVALDGEEKLSSLRGKSGIGQVRYSTTGGSTIKNVQPIVGSFRDVPFWIAHNGNLVNTDSLRSRCLEMGYLFSTTTDTEVIAALIHFSDKQDFETALVDALEMVVGTYALTVLFGNKVYGVRDPSGNRPLILGGDHREGIFMFASETAAFDVLGLKDWPGELCPGEIILIDSPKSFEVRHILKNSDNGNVKKLCLFEYIYFQRPDSALLGRRIQLVREAMGRALWYECPVQADIVVAVPDSGNAAAKGLAKASGLSLEDAFLRSHFIGRTFIEPIKEQREEKLRIKLNIIPEIVAGKRVVVVDDSIVRATVAPKVVQMLRKAGASEIHFRVSSPPYQHPCYYGIDTYRVSDELVARRHAGNVDAIRREIGADSLYYLSLDGAKEAVIYTGTESLERLDFCDACFTGNYEIGREFIPK